MTQGYIWTWHSREKMKYYRLTEARVKRIIRYPIRVEEGVLKDGVACMRMGDGKKGGEIWAMYILEKESGKKCIKVITAWRYPGKSPKRDPIPSNVLREIKNIIF